MEEEDAIFELQGKDRELDTVLAQIQDKDARKKTIEDYLNYVVETLKKRPKLDFPVESEWFNTDSALNHDHLSNRMAVLDFFTYCCINCMHILPDLEAIEESFDQDLVPVIGVHSAKFDNERVGSNVASAIHRYSIHHYVVNDVTATVWQKMNIACWPTVLVLDPQGKPLKYFVGEGHLSRMKEFLTIAIDHFNLSRKSKEKLPQKVLGEHLPSHNLHYPGKIHHSNGSLYISDTGNHRILVASPHGEVHCVVGNGKRGFKDGPFDQAQFSSPQGLCTTSSSLLFVCDTNNHALRMVDFDAKKVTTVTGDGHKNKTLASPWDLCQSEDGKLLFVAMAGSHQIWAYCLQDDVSWWKGAKYTKGQIFLVAGSGKEENRNTSYPLKASFAQPSGLALGNATLFIADSESSSIRCIKLNENGAVKNVCGGGRDPCDLFSYGNQDGNGIAAKLQHPLGVAYGLKSLFVADSYNHDIKKVDGLDEKTALCTSMKIEGLDEPGGLCIDDNILYITDTNHHQIKRLNVESLQVEQIDLKVTFVGNEELDSSRSSDTLINLIQVCPDGGQLNLTINLLLDNNDISLNREAPNGWILTLPPGWIAANLKGNITAENNSFCLEIQHGQVVSEEVIDVKLNLFLCSASKGTCFSQTKWISVTCESRPDAKKSSINETITVHIN